MLNKKIGFTLTELLIALTIIGAIAALSIPSLMGNLNRKQMVTQLKSTITAIQTLAGNQLTIKKSKSLLDTDFSDPQKLLQEKNFQIAKLCNTAADCWSNKYKQISDMSETNLFPPDGKTVVLKNGTVLTYKLDNGYTTNDDKTFGRFYIDMNGKDKPNIVGRDVFEFFISEKGKIMGWYEATGEEYNKETSITDCKSGMGSYCISEILRNNWVMEY